MVKYYICISKLLGFGMQDLKLLSVKTSLKNLCSIGSTEKKIIGLIHKHIS